MSEEPNVVYVMQDGADFHVFEDEECAYLLDTHTAPIKVKDFDIPAAVCARAWFDTNMGYLRVSWVS